MSITPNKAVDDVLAEVHRQDAIGYTAAHDDEHDTGEISAAASAYALAAADQLNPQSQGDGNYQHEAPVMFPDDWDWKPKTPRENLVRAAALAIAEIKRLDRVAAC